MVRGDKGAVVQAQVDVYQNQRWVCALLCVQCARVFIESIYLYICLIDAIYILVSNEAHVCFSCDLEW